MDVDPGVELLADMPIGSAGEDLLDRARFANRVVELACAQPVIAPRVVAVNGDPGSGKSSLLRMVTELLGTKTGVAMVAIDGASYGSAQALTQAVITELVRLFTAAGVVGARDKLHNTLNSYAGVVSDIVRLAVRVDVESQLRRSTDSLRREIIENTRDVGKRIVVVLDHADRLPATELTGMLAALRFYADIPFVAIVVGVDRRALAYKLRTTLGGDPLAYERMVQVELALPPPDRLLLARVLAGGLTRLAERTGKDVDAALELFDPEGGVALELIRTPRDAKRTVNALAAAIPLMPDEVDLYEACLEIVISVMCPEVDTAAFRRSAFGEREKRYLDLDPGVQVALRALIGDEGRLVD
jgi:hypothetical protein